MASRPFFTISTSSTVWRGFNGYIGLADRLGASGIDIDETTLAGRWISRVGRTDQANPITPIASVWLAGTDAAALLGRDHERYARSIESNDVGGDLTLVLRLPEVAGSDGDISTIQNAQRVLERSPWVSSVVIAVPAVASEGGRAHLTRLRSLKRLTEEWDLGLAFDLTARTDNRWEAEAAVHIAGSRLQIVRTGAPLLNGVGRHADVHIRTLRACVDTGFGGTFSFVPPTPFWLGWHAGSIERDLAANRDTLRRIYSEQRIRAVRASSPTRP